MSRDGLAIALQRLPAIDICVAATCCKRFKNSADQALDSMAMDFSRGLESFALPCINEWDCERLPSNYVYVPESVGSPTLIIEDAKCDCSSDGGCHGFCTCTCATNPFHNDLLVNMDIGSIRECGPACHCAKLPRGLCASRNTQYGLAVRLALVKSDKGWGVRAQQAIPRGKFICVYAGQYTTTMEAQRRLVMYDGCKQQPASSAAPDGADAREGFGLRPSGGDGYDELSTGAGARERHEVELANRDTPRKSRRVLPPEHLSSSMEATETKARGQPRWSGHALLVVREVLPSGLALRTNIDATFTGNASRFFNHSCDGGNMRQVLVHRRGVLLPAVAMFASRDICKGEELQFAYGLPTGSPIPAGQPLHTADTSGSCAAPDLRRCLCGSAACRGWMPSME